MSKTPRVLYLAAGYYRPGGVEVYLLHYASEMRRLGFSTQIVVCDALPTVSHWCLKALQDRGIPIESLEDVCRRQMKISLPWVVFAYYLWSLFSGRRWCGSKAIMRQLSKRFQVRRLESVMREYRPDIIHIKGRIMTEALAILPPERTVFHIATAGALDDSWTREEIEQFRLFIERAARVFAPGKKVAERFKREFNINREVTSVFTMSPDAADHETLESRGETGGEKLRFGYLGRFASGKGIPEILAALQKLSLQRYMPPFVFAGEGPLAGEIQNCINQNGLNSVKIVKVASPVTALAGMDVLVLPSESEAMPLVLVEALMCGRPCIATAVGGVPDLIRDQVEGILLADGTSDSVVEAILRFMAMSAPEFSEYRDRARFRYEDRCTPEHVASEVAGHYHAIMATSQVAESKLMR